jgi:hypothetical protein
MYRLKESSWLHVGQYVLKLIKAHTILSAKGSWYEWKRGWVQGLLTNADRALDNLDAVRVALSG